MNITLRSTALAVKSTKLYNSLLNFIVEVASPKTNKYLIGSSIQVIESGKLVKQDFERRLEDVVRTLYVLRSTFSSSVTVNGETFNVSEYNIPSTLDDFMNTGRLFTTQDAIGKCEPSTATFVKDDGTIAKNGEVGIVTPERFNAFWNSFNENQSEGFSRLNLVPFKRKDICYGDLQYAEDAGVLVKVSDVGADEFVCFLADLQINDSNGYAKYDVPTYNAIVNHWKVGK